VEAILRNAHRIDAMVSDLVDSARLECGQLELARETFSPVELLTELVDALGPFDRQRVTLEADRTLPQLEADRQRLGRAVNNLITNALKYSPSGSPVSLRAKASPGSEIVFTVADRGDGIDEDDKPALYRMAKCFVYPSRYEGFGLPVLEAMACGVPVVATKADASREVVRDGNLGTIVDPKNPVEIRDGIVAALKQPRGAVPNGLQEFSFQSFQTRLNLILGDLTAIMINKPEAILPHSAELETEH
jgi:glycosyltransferase involved in cell wall biosynthesis